MPCIYSVSLELSSGKMPAETVTDGGGGASPVPVAFLCPGEAVKGTEGMWGGNQEH